MLCPLGSCGAAEDGEGRGFCYSLFLLVRWREREKIAVWGRWCLAELYEFTRAGGCRMSLCMTWVWLLFLFFLITFVTYSGVNGYRTVLD